MRLPRRLRTSSFRLTLLYAALFSASVLVLFAVIYGATSFYMAGALEAAVDSDLAELQQALGAAGRAGLIDSIAERVKQMPAGPIFYLLEDASGRAVVGNLPPVARIAGIVDLELPQLGVSSGGHVLAIHARGLTLPGGDYLLVGADAFPLIEMREWILEGFGWSFVVTLLLAFGGGALMSGSLSRRVETISRTAREIMAGNLSRRIPIAGTDDEFDHLAASLNAMLDRTEASIEGIRQVSNDIAHDLRTPLTRLRQRLELASRKAASAEELRSAIDRSIADTDAILETFGALLRIAQIESGARKGQFARVCLSDLLHTVAEVYQPTADEKHQALGVAIEPGLFVEGDRELLTQMLANIVENAVRHSPEGAAIKIGGKRAGDAIEVVVADNGPGIPPGERGSVFRRFYRLDASRATPGSGLGLSLAAAIAAVHDAQIALSDNEPGLRVALRLPARDDKRIVVEEDRGTSSRLKTR